MGPGRSADSPAQPLPDAAVPLILHVRTCSCELPHRKCHLPLPACPCPPAPARLPALPQKAAFAGDPVRLRAAITAEERALEMLSKLRDQVRGCAFRQLHQARRRRVCL
jgi:hypothetical protein